MLPVREYRTAPRIPKSTAIIKRMNSTKRRQRMNSRMVMFEASPDDEETKVTYAKRAPAASTMKRGSTQRSQTTASLTPSVKSPVHEVKSGAGFTPRYTRTT
jgi:hypothetical protein